VTTMWLDLLGSQVRYYGNKFRTRVIEAGEGEPLVLIHGLTGSAEAYSRNIMRLSQNFRVLAFDLLWHGFSSKPKFDGLTIASYGEQVIDLLDSLEIKKASVEGLSLGGLITMWLALHHPDRMNKIILNTTAGIVFKPGSPERPPDIGMYPRLNGIASLRNPTRETARDRMYNLVSAPERVTDELVDLRLRIISDPEMSAALLPVAEDFSKNQFGDFRMPEDRLKELSVPTLVLWSEKNPALGPDGGEYIAGLIPNSQYYCIDDAGHWLQWEKPEEHDRVVTAFLKGERVDQRIGTSAGESSS